ncbi:MAG: tetratricopeptide repeat protein, partial [Candidatus Eremiobacteraeota bacterium]|nr:tetratricopeptide repeat protein [Candidatus Eremiobacteraeota bacterium]
MLNKNYTNRFLLLFSILLLVFLAQSFLFSSCVSKRSLSGPVAKSPGIEATGISVMPDTAEDIRMGLENGDLDLDRAWEILNSLLRKNPDDIALLILKSRLCWSGGKFGESLEILNGVLTREPGNPSALTLKTIFLLNSFENEKAKKTAEKLIKINPEDPGNRLLKARVLIRNREYKGAGDILTNLLKDHPDNIECYKWMIEMYDESLRPAEGLEFIDKALKRNWPDPKKNKSYLFFRKGILLERAGKIKDAVKALEKALELDPDNKA